MFQRRLCIIILVFFLYIFDKLEIVWFLEKRDVCSWNGVSSRREENSDDQRFHISRSCKTILSSDTLHKQCLTPPKKSRLTLSVEWPPGK